MTTILESEQEAPVTEDSDLRAMIDAGVHIGHTKSKRHPHMEPYIWMVRGGISIIDVVKTKEKLLGACEALRALAAKNGIILFVGTRPTARDAVRDAALSLGMPYVTRRWIGGTLTNFKVIAKRIEMLASLEQKSIAGEFEKYTKKERLLLERQIESLKQSFDGLRTLTRPPAALVVLNVPQERTAVREAARMRIPVIALVDTNADPKSVTHPIPSNDDAFPAVQFMVGRLAEAVRRGAQEAALAPSAESGGHI